MHAFYNSGAEVMRINASGNVGIGTTAPATKLDISYADNAYLAGITVKNTTNAGAAQSKINIENSAGNILALFQNSPSVSSGTAFIGTSSTHALTLGTDYSETMRIVNNNVGIGSTSPTSKLQVVGLPSYADNTTALAGGLTAGAFYHTAGVLKVVI